MLLKDKIRSINISNNWKTWYIKSESKTFIALSYCEIVFHIIILSFLSIVLWYLVKYKVEPTGTLTYHFLSGPPKDHSLLASHPAEPHLTDQSSLLSLKKQKSLKINIASYFIKTLAFPHSNTWHHIGGTIIQTIGKFSRNPNHQRSVEHTRKTVVSFI